MEIYQITVKGKMVADNPRQAYTPKQKVLCLLNRRGTLSKESILQEVPEANGWDLRKLARFKFIREIGQPQEASYGTAGWSGR